MDEGYLFCRSARQFAEKPCLVNERINRLTNALLGIGIEKGGKVALLQRNCNDGLIYMRYACV